VASIEDNRVIVLLGHSVSIIISPSRKIGREICKKDGKHYGVQFRNALIMGMAFTLEILKCKLLFFLNILK